MKTIEVTDEDYEFLVEAQRLLKTQDTRCTRDPIYCIMERDRLYGIDEEYATDFEWVYDDCDKPATTLELFEYLWDNDSREALINLYNQNADKVLPLDESAKKILRDWFLEEAEDDFTEVCDYLAGIDCYKTYYIEQHKLSESSNMFSLFEADLVDFHKSHNQFPYVECSYRAKRMNQLRELIRGLNLE